MDRPPEDLPETDPPDEGEGTDAPQAPAPPPPPASKGRVRYTLDWPEYWRASEICWRAATGKLFLRLVPASGWLGMITGGVMVALDQKAELAPFFFLFGLAFISSRLFRLRTAKKSFRQRPSVTEMTVEWGPGGITITEGEKESNTIPWEGVRVVLATSAGFLVEPRRHPSLWLPFSGFEAPDGPDVFETEVRAREISWLNRSAVG